MSVGITAQTMLHIQNALGDMTLAEVSETLPCAAQLGQLLTCLCSECQWTCLVSNGACVEAPSGLCDVRAHWTSVLQTAPTICCHQKWPPPLARLVCACSCTASQSTAFREESQPEAFSGASCCRVWISTSRCSFLDKEGPQFSMLSMLSLTSQCMRKSSCKDGLSGLYPADVGYGLLEASPGGCACCSPDLDFRRRGGRLISASEASTSGRTITTHAMATAPAEPVEGPEALQAYLDRRIELFEHFKLRDTEAVKHSPTSVYQMHGTILLRLGGCSLSTPVLGTNDRYSIDRLALW